MTAGHSAAGNGARSTAGFTLLELLVALTVAGIALTAGFVALSTVQERSAHAYESSTAVLESAAVRTLLVDWLSGARRQDSELGERFEGRNAREHALPSDELILPTTGHTPLDVPVTVIRLYVDRDPGTPEQGLVAELLGRVGDEPVRMELVPGVSDMSIRYLPDIDGEVAWASSWVGQDALPRAVELVLLGASDAPLPPLLGLPIRAILPTLR